MVAKKQDLVAIEAQLAKEASEMSRQLGAPEGKKITVDQKGNFVGPGQVNLGNELNVNVVSFCTSKKYYDRPYDSSTPAVPVCFAFGKIIDEMEPEEESPEPQSKTCKTCPHNEWNSAPGGGKACKEGREFAVVLVDDLEEGVKPDLYHMTTAPTSIKFFDGMASSVKRLFNGPPIRAIVTMVTAPVKNYFVLNFGEPEANPHLSETFPLREAADDLISRFPDVSRYVPLAAPKPRKR